MIYLYIVLGILIALILFLLFVPLRLHVEYRDKQLELELWILKFKFDLKKLSDKKEKKPKKQHKEQNKKEQSADGDKQLGLIQKINNTYKKVVYYKNVYNATSKHISKRFITENIEADINFGFSDAAVTGIVTGVVWGLLYEILGLLTLLSTVRTHKFNVDAVYDRFVFEPSFSATFKIKIASIIAILISVLYNLKKYKE